MSEFTCSTTNEKFKRFLDVIQPGLAVHNISIDFPAHEPAILTIERALTEEELEAVTDYFEDADLEKVQYGEITYLMKSPEELGEAEE